MGPGEHGDLCDAVVKHRTFVLLDQLNRDRLGQSSVGIICIKPGYHKGLNSRGLI